MGTHGMFAQNEHGVLLSADLKNYVYSGYYPATTPTESLYTFDVASGPLSMYGIRLAVGGKGAVISAVAIPGGYRVKVFGTSVIGLLVFSPIVDGGRDGHGFALFNAAGQCTFDSNQKHLVCSASGALFQGGVIQSADDVVIYMGTGIYPTVISTSSVIDLDRFGLTTYDGFLLYYRTTATDTYVTWTIRRNVAERTADGFTGVLLQQYSGYYHIIANKQKWMAGPYSRPPGSSIAWRPVSSYGSDGVADARGYEIQNKVLSFYNANNQYPYTASSYNTTQNLALVTNSSLYL